MPKIKHFFFATLIGILCIVGYAVFSMGLFKPVTITHTEAGPFKLLYKDHIGPYHKIMTAIESVEAFAKANGFACAQSFGLYQDDPSAVDQARLRSKGGCIIADNESIPSQLPEGIKIETVSKGKFVQAIFDGSPRIGPLRVYPRLLEEISDKKLVTAKWGVIEIYDIKPDSIRTTYLFPLDN